MALIRSANITVEHFRTKCFYGKNNTWRNPRDFLVKRVSVLSKFIVTAYNILRFSTISEIKKVNSHQTYWPSPPRVCLHMSNDTPWQVKLIFYSTPTAYKLTVSQACKMYVYAIYSRFLIGTILSIRKHGYEFITSLSLSSLMSPFSLSCPPLSCWPLTH